MFRKTVSFILGATTLLAMAGCDGTVADSQVSGGGNTTKAIKTYRIGVIAPLTGDAAVYGIEMQRVMDYRLKEINEDYKPRGIQFELVYEDGKCEGAASAAAFQKLTDIDGIKLINGGVCSSETMGFGPLISEKGALALSWGNSNPDLEGLDPNYFALCYNDALVGQGIADELGKYKKVALISEQNEYNETLRKLVKNHLAAKYPETLIVADEVFPKGSTDMRNTLAKVAASDAEAVLMNSNAGVTAVSLIKQLAEIKDWNKQLVGQVAWAGQDAIDAAPKTLEGAVVIDAPGIQNSDFVDYMEKIVQANGSLDNMGAFFTASSLDSIDLLTSLAAKHDGDVSKIRDELATGEFSGWISDSFRFKGKSFVQGIGVARSVIHDGKRIPQQ